MATQPKPKPGSGTTEGTDPGSAERNLRLMYDEMKADERQRKAREQYDKDKAKNFKKGGRVKRYADGGDVATQQPTYPFYGNTPQPSTTQPETGVNQTFNIQPSASAGRPTQMKKGGKVSSASKRADGCATKGKTRGRMV
jgi:hypothetical protein